MEKPIPEVRLRRTDVRALMDEPRFQKALSEVNFLLAAYSDEGEMSEEAVSLEEAAIEKFNEEFFGIAWLERPMELAIAYDDSDEPDNSSLGVEVVSAKFVAVMPLSYKAKGEVVSREDAVVVREVARRALAFVYTDEIEDRAALIHPDRILEMTVDAPEPLTSETSVISALKAVNELVAYTLHTETFLKGSIEFQKLQLREVIRLATQYYPVFRADNDVVYMITLHSASQQHPAIGVLETSAVSLVFPGLSERKTAYRSVEDFKHGDGLYVELLDADGNERMIAVDMIADIAAKPEPSSLREVADKGRSEASDHANEIDQLAETFQDEEVLQAIVDAENRLNYGEVEEAERMEVIADLRANLVHLVREYFMDCTFRLEGLVYREDDEDEDVLSNQEVGVYDSALVRRFDMKQVDGKWRVAIALEVSTGDVIQTADGLEEELEMIYVIPDADHLSQFVSSYEDDEMYIGYDPQEELRQQLADVSEVCKKIIMSRRYRRLRLDQQKSTLAETIKQAKCDIEQIAPRPSEKGQVICRATRYWAVGWEAEGLTAADIARWPGVSVALDAAVAITGDRITLDIPEINEEATGGKLNGPSAFPLSNGAPMVIIEDSLRKMTYYIPSGTVQLIAPLTEK